MKTLNEYISNEQYLNISDYIFLESDNNEEVLSEDQLKNVANIFAKKVMNVALKSMCGAPVSIIGTGLNDVKIFSLKSKKWLEEQPILFGVNVAGIPLAFGWLNYKDLPYCNMKLGNNVNDLVKTSKKEKVIEKDQISAENIIELAKKGDKVIIDVLKSCMGTNQLIGVSLLGYFVPVAAAVSDFNDSDLKEIGCPKLPNSIVPLVTWVNDIVMKFADKHKKDISKALDNIQDAVKDKSSGVKDDMKEKLYSVVSNIKKKL